VLALIAVIRHQDFGCPLGALVKMGSVECWLVFILLVVGHVIGDSCVVVVVVEFVGCVELVDDVVFFFFCFWRWRWARLCVVRLNMVQLHLTQIHCRLRNLFGPVRQNSWLTRCDKFCQ
jgi:hypothetical protein